MAGTETEGRPAGGRPAVVPPVTRRSFLFRLGMGLNVIAAALASLPILGYVLSSLRQTTWRTWIPLGALDQFPEHETRLATYVNPFRAPWDGETANIPCWVRRMEGARFQVFAINCAHLGCPVRWFPESGLFMCPCHGGVYYQDGSRASGPPPRGLFQYEHRIKEGMLWVRAGQIPTVSQPL